MPTQINKDMTKEEVLTVWIDALRSGDYVQGAEVLTEIHGEQEYDCCLGVLCKLADIPSKVRTLTKEQKTVRKYKFYSETDHTDFLTDGFGYIQWLDRVKRQVLISLNDDHVSFESIAKILERWRDKDLFPMTSYDAKEWLGILDFDFVADEVT